MRVEEFIKNHDHVNYCEAVIFPNGEVEYSIPSHMYKLLLLNGLTLEDIYDHTDKYKEVLKKIPITADPVYWMTEDLQCVLTWYNSVVIPINYTESQIDTIKELIRNGILCKDLIIHVSIEKSITELHRILT